MQAFTIPANLPADVAATVTERAAQCANDPRPRLGLQLRAAELRATSEGMARQLAAGSAT